MKNSIFFYRIQRDRLKEIHHICRICLSHLLVSTIAVKIILIPDVFVQKFSFLLFLGAPVPPLELMSSVPQPVSETHFYFTS